MLFQVINGEDVIKRAIQLLKPGGWLIIEEPDDDKTLDRGKPLGPGMAAFMNAWLGVLRSRGAEPCIGRRLESILESTKAFSEVNVLKVTIPYGGGTGGKLFQVQSVAVLVLTMILVQDTACDVLGTAWMDNALRVAGDLPQRFADHGITMEVTKKHVEELQDPERHITTDMYFTWARKVCS